MILLAIFLCKQKVVIFYLGQRNQQEVCYLHLAVPPTLSEQAHITKPQHSHLVFSNNETSSSANQ